MANREAKKMGGELTFVCRPCLVTEEQTNRSNGESHVSETHVSETHVSETHVSDVNETHVSETHVSDVNETHVSETHDSDVIEVVDDAFIRVRPRFPSEPPEDGQVLVRSWHV